MPACLRRCRLRPLRRQLAAGRPLPAHGNLRRRRDGARRPVRRRRRLPPARPGALGGPATGRARRGAANCRRGHWYRRLGNDPAARRARPALGGDMTMPADVSLPMQPPIVTIWRGTRPDPATLETLIRRILRIRRRTEPAFRRVADPFGSYMKVYAARVLHHVALRADERAPKGPGAKVDVSRWRFIPTIIDGIKRANRRTEREYVDPYTKEPDVGRRYRALVLAGGCARTPRISSWCRSTSRCDRGERRRATGALPR